MTPFKFEGFPAKNVSGKTEHYEGVAYIQRIRDLNPDWRGSETWVLSRFQAKRKGNCAELSDNYFGQLEGWLRRTRSREIEASIEAEGR